MKEPAEAYRLILADAGRREPIATGPQVFAAPTESWTELSVRYLVPARERRKWKSELAVRISERARPAGEFKPRAPCVSTPTDTADYAGWTGSDVEITEAVPPLKRATWQAKSIGDISSAFSVLSALRVLL